MLTKEQIEEIKKDRNLLFFIIDILKLVRKLFLKDRIE